jgi:hypothetical protein
MVDTLDLLQLQCRWIEELVVHIVVEMNHIALKNYSLKKNK